MADPIKDRIRVEYVCHWCKHKVAVLYEEVEGDAPADLLKHLTDLAKLTGCKLFYKLSPSEGKVEVYLTCPECDKTLPE